MFDSVFIECSDSLRVNFFKNLFSHHQHSQTTPAVLFNWPGQSGKEYQYDIYPIGSSFQALPGNYIYARQTEDGNWVPIYIAQTRDLHQRLEGHVKLDDAIQNGATHIHAHYCSAGQASRCTEERDLIVRWAPVCNEPVES